jgi:hypothetical protein
VFNIGPELLILPFLLLFVAGFVVWIWTLIDAIRVSDDSMYRAGNKLVWVLVIVFGGIIGSIVYLAIGRPSGSAPGQRPAAPPPPPAAGGLGRPVSDGLH